MGGKPNPMVALRMTARMLPGVPDWTSDAVRDDLAGCSGRAAAGCAKAPVRAATAVVCCAGATCSCGRAASGCEEGTAGGVVVQG